MTFDYEEFSLNQLESFYPFSDEYVYETVLERINLDQEKVRDLKRGKGFVVADSKTIKKAIRDENGIFSPKFGQTLDDLNVFQERYKCSCGKLKGRVYANSTTCPDCKTRVEFVDDDFEFFGWIELKEDYPIIHPNLYKSLEALITEAKLNNILYPIDEKDQDGKTIENAKKKTDEPYEGLGMLDFYHKYQEIMEYYVKKNPSKMDIYEDIMKHKESLFIHSIPVFTTHLRPWKEDKESLYFNDMNKYYNMMVKLTKYINADNLRIRKEPKPRNKALFEMQTNYNLLYKELVEILSGKKGTVRALFGGRYNFTARDVIVPNIKMELDEVTLSYYAAVEMMQQTIINILVKSNNMSYNDAYNIVYRATLEFDERVYTILLGLIENSPRGIPILINRNPTINYGGILQMFVVGINKDYTLGIPLDILKLLAGDFDGDVLNIVYIINQQFFEYANKVFNPANAMVINRNDGMLNPDVIPSRDTMINLHTFVSLGRPFYTQEMKDVINKAKSVTVVY